MPHYLVSLLALALLLAGCGRKPPENKVGAMRPAAKPQIPDDDLDYGEFVRVLSYQVDSMKKSPALFSGGFQLGSKLVSKANYVSALEQLLANVQQGKKLSEVVSPFELFEVYGDKQWGEVLLTSYYEPVIKGSRTRTLQYSEPLYRKPADLVSASLIKFDKKFASNGIIRGRVQESEFVPYYTRKEIDSDGALKGKKLELCWADPIEAFFLQIQGSGTVQLSDKTELRLGYAEQNGHPYETIGRHLLGILYPGPITSHRIEEFLRSLPPRKMQAFLELNPSYVFFRELRGRPETASGFPVIDGRTIATDMRFFPKGTVGLLIFDRPNFKDASSTEPISWTKVARLVVDHDTGGAIKGGGRVDLFWGKGDLAKQSAGVIKQKARLYYLVPRT